MPNWEGITEFVAVAESNSFTLAAQKLSTSVAQVSRRIAALENRLSVKLFNRTTRKISLTEAGTIYFQNCKVLVEGLKQAELSVTQMQSTPQGLIRITAPTTYGEQIIAPLINEFLLMYPSVVIDLILTNQKLDLIEAGVDVAIRLGALEDSRLIAKKLSNRQLYLCASPTYIKQHGKPHSLACIKQHQCLVGSVNYWRFLDKNQEKSISVNGRLMCNSGPSLLDAALKGLGIAQLPDFYVKKHLDVGNLIEVLAEHRVNQDGIWALYPENRNLSTKVRLIIDYFTTHLNR